VVLGVERRGSEVVFTIDDDGPGVQQDERERIFEPGVRGSAGGGDRAFPGAGLGLALSRRLARAASGDVVASTDRRGGCFLVRLPSG
jgi:signal transduction histidine kinase